MGGQPEGPATKLTPEEWVLAVLAASGDRPIRGKLMLMKTMFILAKEIAPDADRILAFYPKDYGPFSREVAKAVASLAESGSVRAQGAGTEKETDRTDFYPTRDGLLRGEKVLEALPSDIQQRIRELRAGAEEMGYTGIVRYVYARYPEYISASKIRKAIEVDY